MLFDVRIFLHLGFFLEEQINIWSVVGYKAVPVGFTITSPIGNPERRCSLKVEVRWCIGLLLSYIYDIYVEANSQCGVRSNLLQCSSV